jgi:hypothetical protein
VQVAQFDMQTMLLSVQAAANTRDEQSFREAMSMPYEKRLEFDAALAAEPAPESESDRIRRELGVA